MLHEMPVEPALSPHLRSTEGHPRPHRAQRRHGAQ